MSLINELLIAVDRRSGEGLESRDRTLDGLAPVRTAPPGASRWRVAGIATGAVSAVALGLSLGLALGFPFGAGRHASRARDVGEPASSLPRVAAPPAPPATPITELSIERAVAIRSLSLAREDGRTRLRIQADESVPYRIDGLEQGSSLEIRLESTVLRAPPTSLDLLDSPIRSLQMQSGDGGVRLRLLLDPEIRVQSRWERSPSTATLVVDLQSPSVAVAAPPASRDLGEAKVSAISSDPETPPSVRIHRSAHDHERRDRELARKGARGLLQTARRAREEGKGSQARELYRAALAEPLQSRDRRQGIRELAALLVEADEPDEALELLRVERLDTPHDAALVMLHAQLLAAKGDRVGAVRALDDAALPLAEAPEVHALAAAYAQQEGNHADAITRYERIVRRFPQEARGWTGLGISLEAEGRPREALDVYRIAMQVGELPDPTRRWVSARVESLAEEG